MNSLIKNIIFFTALLSAHIGISQVYPVQAFVQLSPPYSGYLPDYADAFNEQFKIILTLNDFSIPNYSVKVKLKIEGDGFVMQTKSYITMPQIDLTPGVPVQISGTDLGFYLSSSNLDFTGINVSDYETKKILPEGQYKICVEVYDYFSVSNLQVGNSECTYAWFNLQEPPLLNTPLCGAEINPTNPQNIVFTWTPLSMSSAWSIYTTEYEFSLYEIRPANTNPNIVIATTLPIFTTTTNQTFYNYSIMEPTLQAGMSYAWKVRAYCTDGRDNYKNNGNSQVCSFSYGNLGAIVTNGITLELSANSLGPRLAQANWNASSLFTSYTLELRKTGNSENEWFSYSSSDGNLKLTSLEPQTEYECKVKGYSGTYESEYSNTTTFTTLALPNYNCNSTVQPPQETGAAPFTGILKAGDIVEAGQFEMIILTANATDVQGRYSGTGKINVPFTLLNFNVTFTNIFLDENLKFREGRIDVITQPIDQWVAGALDDNTEPDYEFEGDIDSIHLEGTTITIFADGEQVNINYPGGTFVIEDDNGDQWHVYPDGTVTYIPLFPHIELNDNEKNLYKAAMQKLREEYNNSRITEIKDSLGTNSTILKEQIESLTTIDYDNIDTSSIQYVFVSNISDVEITDPNLNEAKLRISEFDYFLAQTCNGMAKENPSQSDFDFLANGVMIEGKKSYIYIRNALEYGTSENEIVNTLKTEIKATIITYLKTKLYQESNEN